MWEVLPGQVWSLAFTDQSDLTLLMNINDCSPRQPAKRKCSARTRLCAALREIKLIVIFCVSGNKKTPKTSDCPFDA